jgi:hypothetical protein
MPTSLFDFSASAVDGKINKLLFSLLAKAKFAQYFNAVLDKSSVTF